MNKSLISCVRLGFQNGSKRQKESEQSPRASSILKCRKLHSELFLTDSAGLSVARAGSCQTREGGRDSQCSSLKMFRCLLLPAQDSPAQSRSHFPQCSSYTCSPVPASCPHTLGSSHIPSQGLWPQRQSQRSGGKLSAEGNWELPAPPPLFTPSLLCLLWRTNSFHSLQRYLSCFFTCSNMSWHLNSRSLVL